MDVCESNSVCDWGWSCLGVVVSWVQRYGTYLCVLGIVSRVGLL